MKTVVITGATGFVGRRLCLALFRQGHQLKILCRSVEKAKLTIPLPAEFIRWDGKEQLDEKYLEGSDAIIHLAGAPIAEGRWNAKRKSEILHSRTLSTLNLVAAVKRCRLPPKLLVGASAIGIYGDRAEEVLSENAQCGEGFLANVCGQWEAAEASFPGRTVMLRTGVVLGHGGALRKMLPAFRLGGGGRLGDGQQWMSWIHIEDLINLYLFALENESLSGPVNAVAPASVTNREFTRALAKTLGVSAVLPIPRFMLKLIFGEMSCVLLDSQRVTPKRALESGFSFSYPEILPALASLLCARGHKGSHVFQSYQWIPQDRLGVFDFFSKAENLETITPPWINFRIESKNHAEIQEGTLIDYRLKIKGLPAKWRTRISRWQPPAEFADSQLRGPYSLWEHVHRFEEAGQGTLMTDEIVYRVPFGPVGHIVNEIVIRDDVEAIFKYRTSCMSKHFAG